MTKNIFYLIVTVILMVLTLGGLGNAAMSEPFYWVPFAVNLIIFLVLFLKEVKAMNKVVSTPGTGSGAAHPVEGENEKEVTIVDKTKTKKEGR